MNKIYVTSVVGAPSSTAVIISDDEISKINWQDIASKTYYFLKSKNIVFSKLAIIKLKSDNIWDYKFIQIKNKNNILEFESNANCGNSMIASARVIFMISKSTNNIILTNIDTKLEVSVINQGDSFDIEFCSLIGKSIYSFQMFGINEKINIVKRFGNINASIIDVVNPYIIVNAEGFGIETSEELLKLDLNDRNIIEKVKEVRKDIIKEYNFSENSEFPKIAIVLHKDKIASRTIYLDNWHKGLPITAAISVIVVSKIKNSSIYREDSEINEILTPKESKRISIKTNPKGIILECKMFSIKSKGEIDIYTYDSLYSKKI